MTRVGAIRPFGRLVIATLVFACLAMSAMLLWRRFGSDDRTPEDSGATAAGAEQFAEPPPSPPPAQPPSSMGIGERAPSAESPSQPQGEKRAEPRVEGGL